MPASTFGNGDNSNHIDKSSCAKTGVLLGGWFMRYKYFQNINLKLIGKIRRLFHVGAFKMQNPANAINSGRTTPPYGGIKRPGRCCFWFPGNSFPTGNHKHKYGYNKQPHKSFLR
jgi:hypothetical protein